MMVTAGQVDVLETTVDKMALFQGNLETPQDLTEMMEVRDVRHPDNLVIQTDYTVKMIDMTMQMRKKI